MFSAFAKAFDQLSDPRTRSVLWLGLTLSVVVFIVLWTAVGFGLDYLQVFEQGWLDTILDILGGAGAFVLSLFLFPAVVSAFIGLFLERVAQAVESRHYPGLPPARETPVIEAILEGLKFLIILVLLNIMTLFFLIPPFTPLFPFVAYSVNGYLLGREYFELVAARRLAPTQVRSLRRSHRIGVFTAGLVLAFLLVVPVVNLLAPIVGTAAMVHLFQAWNVRT